mmetsp:Transcript_30106/g.32813  ORF Transcript_30106/g.32813 Transcript_30106/m.32813 type:complete len:87 (+) Transcript_30106:1076-1336(+)
MTAFSLFTFIFHNASKALVCFFEVGNSAVLSTLADLPCGRIPIYGYEREKREEEMILVAISVVLKFCYLQLFFSFLYQHLCLVCFV